MEKSLTSITMLPVIEINVCLELKSKLCILCLVLTSHTLLACWSTGKYYDWQTTSVKGPIRDGTYFETKLNPSYRYLPYKQRYLHMGLHGFDLFPQVARNWTDWYTKESKRQKEVSYINERNKKKVLADRGADWPTLPGWADLGEGLDGSPVPPWAYTVKHMGLPQACMQPIQSFGFCLDTSLNNKEKIGYGYNPYYGICFRYITNECHFNLNFFATLEQCEAYCVESPPNSNCNKDTNIPIDYTYIYDQK
ncbi:hypothetical protein HW555_001945 [Spodoptera exigua]|uniref:BPTI/Kunitz inhibitor domain-containing protein n=1 Tax=Spodoptera exigua TaxID=7107 RepID=A0A835GPC9_SPOEX|nr:hypothetical protein HW555_001945 [Spodoptera exigua]